MKKQNNNKAFSIIVAIFMIGFLIILTTWILNLVIREMKDNKWSENYQKAYAWAEWAMELWLLKIKTNSYSYDQDLEKTSSWAETLSFNNTFNKNKDPKITYTMDIKTNNIIKWVIWTGSESTVIIPLFWQDENNDWSTTRIELKNIKIHQEDWRGSNADNNIIWNVIWKSWWNSWTWTFDEFKNNTFLEKNENKKSYLVLFNTNSTEKIEYDLLAKNWEYFSNPNWNITSSVTVGKYKQNISTNIDNTKFLKMLKYSLYIKENIKENGSN